MLGLELVGAHCVHDERHRQDQLRQSNAEMEKKLRNLNAMQLRLRGRIEEHTTSMLLQTKLESLPEGQDGKPAAVAGSVPLDSNNVHLEEAPTGFTAALTAGLTAGLPVGLPITSG